VSQQLERLRRDPAFMGNTSPNLVLSRDFVIQAATPTYTATVGRSEDDLLGVSVFEAFPENEPTAEAGSTISLVQGVERVLRTGRPNHLAPVRYDIPDADRPNGFLVKRWVMANSPIRDGDDVVGVMTRVEDVTPLDADLLHALRRYRDLLASGDLRTRAARRRVSNARAFVAIAESHFRLVTEVLELRKALHTRPTIDQAKGIIMADRHCTPDQAFQLLKQLSMDTNVRLADVAAAIVYQAQSPS
jgi:response regulator NasT